MFQNRKGFYYGFICVVILLATVKAKGQEVVADSLSKEFTAYQNRNFEEKIFVHTDKTFYVTGEILWFKLYLVDALSNHPADISKVAYVEIIGEQNTPVLQAKISMKDGKGNGSFAIPSSVVSGSYVLRAYTNWMKNFSPELYFTKPVTIVNTLKKPDWKETGNANGHVLELFPEGGNLVYGLQSTVAFKLTDKYGKAKACSGTLVNAENDTVARFESFKFGMGTFRFVPEAGNQYKAVVQIGDTIVSKELLSISQHGYVMHLSPGGREKAEIEVQSNKPGDENIFLLVHRKGSVILARKNAMRSNKTTFSIDKSLLPEGVSYLTVFDQNKKPVCERLFFKRPSKQLAIKLDSKSKTYDVRENVALTIETLESTGKPVDANMSVSVFLVDSLQKNEPDNIAHYFWLTSELNGFVESPGYYFDNEEETDRATNNLMLTHGWRRFKSNTNTADETAFEYLPEYEGHIIQGSTVHKQTKSPARGITTYLSVPGQNFYFNNAVSDERGRFHFVMKDFQSGNGIIIQTDTLTAGQEVNVQNPFSEKYAAIQFPFFELSKDNEKNLLLRSESAQVQHIYTSEKIHQFRSYSDSVPFYGPAVKTYWLDEFTRFPTMEEVLREYVEEVRVRKGKDGYYYQVLNAPFKTFFELQPLILIDGVPVFDTDKAVSFDPLKVKKIDVVAGRYHYGPAIYNGIVSYTTYAGNANELELDPKAVVLEYEGLQRQREFYAPVYETEEHKKSRLPDFRNLLHWAPDVRTDVSGKAALSFYTSDLAGRYAIVVQGITVEGLAGSSISVIEVKRNIR